MLHKACCGIKSDLNRITQKLITSWVRLAAVKPTTNTQTALSFYALGIIMFHLIFSESEMAKEYMGIFSSLQMTFSQGERMFVQIQIKMQLLYHSPRKQSMPLNKRIPKADANVCTKPERVNIIT